MGRQSFSRKGGQGGQKRQRENVFRVIEQKNVEFEEYYFKWQKIVEDETELGLLMEAMKTPLPVALRVNGTAEVNEVVLRTLDNLAEAKKLEWYDGGDAFQWDGMDRAELRKNADYKKLKQLIVSEDNRGSITRQETVSLLPPVCLGVSVEENTKVLDLCAAPGSKTTEMLEMTSNPMSHEGFVTVNNGAAVIGNDIDMKRVHLLHHRTSLTGYPHIALSCIDGSFFPAPQKANQNMFFSHVLADVPCSGDGTFRKNPNLWADWTPLGGHGLHARQVKILQRALRLVKPGGSCVYSTCSLNPIEDEAVLYAVLKNLDKKYEIDDINPSTDFKFSRGKVDWAVANPDFFMKKEIMEKEFPGLEIPKYFCSRKQFDDYRTKVLASRTSKISSVALSMFGDPEDPLMTKIASCCVRIQPHQNNTGGFFVALIHRLDNPSQDADAGADVIATPTASGSDENTVPATQQAPTVAPTDDDNTRAPVKIDSREDSVDKEANNDLYWIASRDKDQKLRSFLQFFGMLGNEDVSFSADIEDTAGLESAVAYSSKDHRSSVLSSEDLCFMRKDSSDKRFYLTSRALAELIEGYQPEFKFIAAGLKAAEYDGAVEGEANEMRMAQQAARYLAPYVTRRIIFVNDFVMRLCLTGRRSITKDLLIKAESMGAVCNLDSCRGASSRLVQRGSVLVVRVPPSIIPHITGIADEDKWAPVSIADSNYVGINSWFTASCNISTGGTLSPMINKNDLLALGQLLGYMDAE